MTQAVVDRHSSQGLWSHFAVNDSKLFKRQMRIYNQAIVLSTETQRIVASICSEVNGEESSPSDVPALDAASEEMQWETVPSELNGDQEFLHGMHDMLSNRWDGVHYRRDHCSRHKKFQQTWAHWQPLLPSLTDTLIKWKNILAAEPLPPEANEPEDKIEDEPFEIYMASIALVQNGYLGASPLVPTLAISLKTLELYRHLRLRKPSFSYEAFMKVLCDLYNVPYRQRWRNALANTYDIFLLLHHQIDARVRSVLGRDTENWCVLHACPSCGYELEGEPELTFRRMLVLDGNNSLKHIACIGQREVADSRVYMGSDYFLSPDFVDTFTQDNPPSIVVEHSAPLQTDPEPEADQHEDDAIAEYRVDSACADNWKAASSNERKQMWALFDETGIFACACHHGFMLWLTDMVRSRELAKYPLAMVAKALQVLSDRILIGYDIRCSFKSTVASSTLSSQAQAMRFCINTFHSYSHSYSCQVNNHPNIIPGMGLEDLETLEHVFSLSNQLAAVVCYSSAFQRRLAINAFFQQWDEDKYLNLGTMILNNYKQALWILNEESIVLEEAKKMLGIQPGDLEK
ncbi:hypothetical protein BDN71DRAFT_1511118 [Pleurotus eryngii]|uniref:CxC1-like cysteine cluster associated with KDZ transposases domain-containing protein n=1 Tax=Pleurotus eryngii TaxID=5323 RepID=A0A9P6DBE9_PLEER|nr:hypothetical protein BDN71DRAFT_1511118 [Pleurotus eryngii]